MSLMNTPAQEMDPQPEEKPGNGAQWPEGQDIKPDPEPGSDAEGAAEPGAAAEQDAEALEVEQVAMRAGSQQVAPTTGVVPSLPVVVTGNRHHCSYRSPANPKNALADTMRTCRGKEAKQRCMTHRMSS